MVIYHVRRAILFMKRVQLAYIDQKVRKVSSNEICDTIFFVQGICYLYPIIFDDQFIFSG